MGKILPFDPDNAHCLINEDVAVEAKYVPVKQAIQNVVDMSDRISKCIMLIEGKDKKYYLEAMGGGVSASDLVYMIELLKAQIFSDGQIEDFRAFVQGHVI